MAAGYREEQARQLLSDESRRSVLIDSLLYGRLFEQSSVWEAADSLRLPTNGPYVVVAAEVPVVGAEALPEIESKLRGMDMYSAWRLLPDLVSRRSSKRALTPIRPVAKRDTSVCNTVPSLNEPARREVSRH
jgi:hypothetical protein